MKLGELINDPTVGQVYETLSGRQLNMMYTLVGYALATGRRYLRTSKKFYNAEQHELHNIYDTLSKNQRILVDTMIKRAIGKYTKNKED